MQLTPSISALDIMSQRELSDGKPSKLPASAIEQVGVEFESVFASMLIKQMRESSASGMFEGDGSDTYGAMFDMFIGQHAAQVGGLGIKEMLVARYAQNASPELVAPATTLATVHAGDAASPASVGSLPTPRPLDNVSF